MTNKDSAPPPLLDANLLQLFELIYSTRSAHRAARQLELAQPTVSIWLGKLRKHTPRRPTVRPHAVGHATHAGGRRPDRPRCGRRSNALRALSQEVRFDPTTSDRRFRIGMTDASHITLLPQLLAHVRSVAPGVRLGAEQIDGQIGARLESGEADLALGFIPELGAGYQQSLYTQDWVCLAGNHPRITETLTLADYQREEHIHIVSGTGHSLLDPVWNATTLPHRVVLELPSRTSATIVSTTDLLVTLPRHIGETLCASAACAFFPARFPFPASPSDALARPLPQRPGQPLAARSLLRRCSCGSRGGYSVVGKND